ncbi:uncharacterized protein MEPE_00752 [Melanopsichium pennsylvanicum]|uniref:OPA3-domain-containing protein n=1 Tax=Melanopsichium pennsylvanicum TaxID=63383 RepID=A0AAJ4XH90_9BASI|nr:uncharacterized protein MEPE_00752 [Melanopsichium pennsylvanicum]
MATAKIATLAIRTLAKPIATQLKSQAAQHESFKKRMHRTEMALRTNLLPNGVQQKVRPLNDAKAIANGANAISEGFLFFVAAALIVGETYRSSRQKAKQRDRTEDALDQLKDQLEEMATVLGIDLDQLRQVSDSEGEDLEAAASAGRKVADKNGVVTEEADPSLVEARLKVYHDRQNEELKSRQLQAAVSVLLNLALKNRWVVGPEALELEGILGSKRADARVSYQDQITHDQATTTSDLSIPNKAQSPRGTPDDSEPLLRPSIIQQVALERAKALAREARGETSSNAEPVDASLANLLAQHKQSATA